MVKTSDWESKHNGNPHENGLILGTRPMCGPTSLCVLILVDSTWLVFDTANQDLVTEPLKSRKMVVLWDSNGVLMGFIIIFHLVTP